jgi:hypothetical protein
VLVSLLLVPSLFLIFLLSKLVESSKQEYPKQSTSTAKLNHSCVYRMWERCLVNCTCRL